MMNKPSDRYKGQTEIMFDKRGFTLVELLVVISIIGLLATIMLINVNSARNKAKNATIKSNIDTTKPVAELYYSDPAHGNYASVCASSDFVRINAALVTQGASYAFRCFDSATAYCAEANLATGGEWCADSVGYSGTTASCASGHLSCQ